MKNRLTNLNDYLFEQIERLCDEDLKGEDLHQEIERSRAISGISREVIKGAQVLLDAKKHSDGNLPFASRPAMPGVLSDQPKLIGKDS